MFSRRRFLQIAAASSGLAVTGSDLLSQAVANASSMTRPNGSNGIRHVAILMQENRSFDHYFGTFPGVRGFSDPKAIKLPNGQSVFQQPDPANPDGYLEPFHMSTITTGAAAIPDLSHDWRAQHQSWNNGLMDGWLRAHIAFDGPAVGPYTMGYHTQEDVP